MITGLSGNYIFLPAADQRYDTKIISQNNVGYYWLGTLYSYDWLGTLHNNVSCLSFSKAQYQASFTQRYFGCSARPVSK